MRKRENERRDDSGGRERKTVMRARAGCVCVCGGGANARQSSHANWLQWITF